MEPSEPFPETLMLVTNIVIQADLNTIISIIISFLLLVLSALISGAETAYFSLRSEQVKEIEKKTDFRSRLIIRHIKNQENFWPPLPLPMAL